MVSVPPGDEAAWALICWSSGLIAGKSSTCIANMSMSPQQLSYMICLQDNCIRSKIQVVMKVAEGWCNNLEHQLGNTTSRGCDL